MTNVREKCERCQKSQAKFIVDIHAAVTILGKMLCTRCFHWVMRTHPQSSGVAIREYE